MIRITCARAPGESRLRARGHAEGSAAACAAVSALLYALANWAGPQRAAVARGRADIKLPRTPAADAAFDLTVLGLAQVASVQPREVRVEEG